MIKIFVYLNKPSKDFQTFTHRRIVRSIKGSVMSRNFEPKINAFCIFEPQKCGLTYAMRQENKINLKWCFPFSGFAFFSLHFCYFFFFVHFNFFI